MPLSLNRLRTEDSIKAYGGGVHEANVSDSIGACKAITDSEFLIPDSGTTALFDLYPEIWIQKSRISNQRPLESKVSGIRNPESGLKGIRNQG
jgi:hypothetical protein